MRFKVLYCTETVLLVGAEHARTSVAGADVTVVTNRKHYSYIGRSVSRLVFYATSIVNVSEYDNRNARLAKSLSFVSKYCATESFR